MLNLVILTAHPELYTNQRLRQEGPEHGYDVTIHTPPAWWEAPPKGIAEPGSGWLLARPGAFSMKRILREHRELVRLGFVPLQSRKSLLDACDQWRTLRRLRQYDVAIPESILIRDIGELDRAKHRVPGSSWILKGRWGSKGSHVMLAENARSLVQNGHFFWGQGQTFVVQEDCRRLGAVRRFLVADSEVIAAAEATAAPGDFRTNWHRGGHFRALEDPLPDHGRLAIRAAGALRLPFAGIDLIGDETPLVLEVNASVGIEGLEAVSRRDLAGEILKRFDRSAMDPTQWP